MTEVKHEASDSPWKQMTSQAAQMTNKQRMDPYSKVVLTVGSGPGPHLGLCGVDYAGGLAASNFEYQGHYNNLNESPGQSPYSISQPLPDYSNGLANLNIASPIAAMVNPPNPMIVHKGYRRCDSACCDLAFAKPNPMINTADQLGSNLTCAGHLHGHQDWSPVTLSCPSL